MRNHMKTLFYKSQKQKPQHFLMISYFHQEFKLKFLLMHVSMFTGGETEKRPWVQI